MQAGFNRCYAPRALKPALGRGQLVGHLRDHTQAELVLLHKIQAMQSRIGSHFSPPRKCSSTVRDGAKVTKSCDELLTLAIAIAKGQPTC